MIQMFEFWEKVLGLVQQMVCESAMEKVPGLEAVSQVEHVNSPLLQEQKVEEEKPPFYVLKLHCQVALTAVPLYP